MKSVKVDEVVLSAKPGGVIDECLREAIILCATEDRRVVVKHNGRLYKISLSALRSTFVVEEDPRMNAKP